MARSDEYWYVRGKLHREDGPAEVWPNMYSKWYRYGKLHRVGGPAVEWKHGPCQYYFNGKLHRLDGPAIYHNLFMMADQYFVDGIEYSKGLEYLMAVEEFKQKPVDYYMV